MKPRLLILIAAILLLFSSLAGAAIINTSVILGATPGTTITLHYPPSSTSSYSYSVNGSTDVIAYATYTCQWAESSKTYFSLSRGDGTKVTGHFELTPDWTQFTGSQKGYIDGGSGVSTNTYSRIPVLNAIYPSDWNAIFVKSNDTGSAKYYLVLSANTGYQTISGEYTVGAPYSLDTTKDAYLELPAAPSKNPIVSASTYNTGGGKFIAYYASTPFTSFAYSETNADNPIAAQGILDLVLGQVWGTIQALLGLGSTAGSLFSYTTIIAAFIFTAQFFVGFSILYIFISVLLAIEDSDDIFKSFGAIVRSVRKLFAFYMEIFKAIKSFIKWW
jgi:hypothetical protein